MNSNRNANNSHLNSDKDPLFELIGSMSANEKRYFNVQVKNIRNNDGTLPDYLVFFQILNKMKVYDEEKAIKKLLQKLGKERFSNFTVKKNELYDVLMRHLKNYHFTRMKKSASYIKILIQDANFLFKRGLYKQANRYLKDARKMAEKCGDTLSLIEINRFEREFLRTNREIKRGEHLEGLHKEEGKLIENLSQESMLIKKCDLLAAQFLQKTRVTGKESFEDLNKEFQHLKEMQYKNDLSILSQRFLNASLSNYYVLIGESKSHHETMKASFEWWKNNELWRKQMPHYYIATLSNLLSTFNRKKDYSQFPRILKMIEEIETSNQHESAVRFHRLMFNRQIYYMNTGLLDEACNLIPRIEKGIKTYKINKGVQIVLIYNSIIAYFANHKFSKCVELSAFFDSLKKGRSVKLQIQFVQLLKIIGAYEIGNFEMMEKSYRSAKKYFLEYLGKKPNEFEVITLESINELSRAIPSKQKGILEDLKNKIKSFQAVKETYRSIGAEEMLLWIESKLTDQPMSKIISENIKKRAVE